MDIHYEQHFYKVEFLKNNFLRNLCSGQHVLEVGCFEGEITKHIVECSPKSLCLLEASSGCINRLQEKFPQARVIHGDMHDDFDHVGSVEVAILLGVIYHTHAPLFVLEQLVNCCSPKHIVLDNMSQSLGWHIEIPNQPGMRYVLGDKKCCNIVINIGDEIIASALDNLGYQLITHAQYPEQTRSPGMPVFHFEKRV